MILTKEQTKEMLEAAKPLMKWISDNELTEGVALEITNEFIKD